MGYMEKLFMAAVGGGFIAYGLAQRKKSRQNRDNPGINEADHSAQTDGAVCIVIGVIALLGVFL